MARRSSAVGARVAAADLAASGAGLDRLPLPFVAGSTADFAILPPPGEAAGRAALMALPSPAGAAGKEERSAKGKASPARRSRSRKAAANVETKAGAGAEDTGLHGQSQGGPPEAGGRLSLAGGRSFEDGVEPLPPGFDRWLERARGLGLGPGELVWELHVVQGRSLPATARLLGMPCAEAAELHAGGRARAGERAPKSDADFQAVREEVRDRLVSIIEDASRAPEDPRLLAIRQRACDQLADLYGLKMQRRGGAAAEEAPPVYAPPEDLAALVEARVRNLYGRAGEIEAARKVLGEG